MSRKDYEKAAELVQSFMQTEDTSQERHANRLLVTAFVAFFRDDNPRFDAERFRAACQPGANVRARGKKVA